jgi:2-oxoisovalerate dehydrogenase E1 component beta subunit
MKAAIRDDNPVLFFEYKYLYRRIKEELPLKEEPLSLGRGKMRRNGTDATVISYGPTVHVALEAAEEISRKDGVECQVVDLRSLVPMDWDLIYDCVRMTGKVLIVHEATLTGGVGAEIAARISEHTFEHLDAPVRRLGALDTPVPFAPTLEEAFLPNASKVAHAIRDLCRY